MTDTNKITLHGNLVREPKIIATRNDSIIALFTLAIDRVGRKGTDFLECKAFGEEAETLATRATKGTEVKLIGSLRSESFDRHVGAKKTQREYKQVVVPEYLEITNRGLVVNEAPAEQAPEAPAEADAEVAAA